LCSRESSNAVLNQCILEQDNKVHWAQWREDRHCTTDACTRRTQLRMGEVLCWWRRRRANSEEAGQLYNVLHIDQLHLHMHAVMIRVLPRGVRSGHHRRHRTRQMWQAAVFKYAQSDKGIPARTHQNLTLKNMTFTILYCAAPTETSMQTACFEKLGGNTHWFKEISSLGCGAACTSSHCLLLCVTLSSADANRHMSFTNPRRISAWRAVAATRGRDGA
jgi:hypothetical protein